VQGGTKKKNEFTNSERDSRQTPGCLRGALEGERLWIGTMKVGLRNGKNDLPKEAKGAESQEKKEAVCCLASIKPI